VDVNKVVDFEAALLAYMKSEKSDLLESINTTPELNESVETALREALEQFKATSTW
jgi:F-type H+-transporting ATPase subunit alpha